MLSVVTVVVMVGFGLALARRLWTEEAITPLERITAAGTIALTVWIASTWALALAHALTFGALLARTAMLAIAAAVLLRRPAAFPRLTRPELGAAAVVLAWCAYILYRGWLLPPISHDALAYHLPKALLYVLRHGYDELAFLPARIRDLPVNYELLMADVIASDSHDTFTEWPSLLSYAFFVVGCGALTQRWWSPHRTSDVSMLLVVAATPVALLHSGAHKNDLLVIGGMVAAMVFAGRWFSERDVKSLALVVCALGIAVGTKPQAAILAAALAPVLLWRIHRDLQLKQAAVIIVFCAGAVGLLGGVSYLHKQTESERTVIAQPAPIAHAAKGYGDWANLWQGPYVLFAAPFSTRPNALAVPWSERLWFWQRYEIFFSHLGVIFAISALALPIAIVVYRRAARDRLMERIVITLAAGATFLALLPVRFSPHGMYAISLPRYVLFFVPVVLGWTLGPWIRDLAAKKDRWGTLTVIVATVAFVIAAFDNGVNDRFAPLSHVLQANRGSRFIPFDPSRATSAIDRHAEPREVVAVELADGTWIYPAFGADLGRTLLFVRPTTDLRRVPDQVCWLVFERAFESAWKNPGFDDISKGAQFMGRNVPLQDDRLFLQAYRSQEWKLVYRQLFRGQAIFYRSNCGKPYNSGDER